MGPVVRRRSLRPISLFVLFALLAGLGMIGSGAVGAMGDPLAWAHAERDEVLNAPAGQTYSTPVRRTVTPARPPAAAPPAEIRAAAMVPVGDGLANPGFELGDEGWYLESGAASDSSNPHGGNRALRVPPRGFADQRVRAVPGGRYLLSAWGKLSAAGEMGRVGVTYWDASGKRLEADEPRPLEFADTSYVRQSLEFALPADVAAVAVFASKGSGSASFFVDDIELTPAEEGTPAAAPPPGAAGPLFSDDFESGSFARWSDEPVGIALVSDDASGGARSARARSDGEATYIRTDLGSPQPGLYVRIRFKIVSQGETSTVNLARVRTSRDRSIAGVFVSREGRIGVLNDVTKESVTARGDDAPIVAAGEWHELQFHVQTGEDSLIEVWYDGAPLESLTRRGLDLGPEPIGRLQIGENASAGKTYDVLLDDVVADTRFIPSAGPGDRPELEGTPATPASPTGPPAASPAAMLAATSAPTAVPRQTVTRAATATIAPSPTPVPTLPPPTPPPAATPEPPTSTPTAASPSASPTLSQGGAMFRGGPERAGVYAGNGPSRKPGIAWTVATHRGVVSSAAVTDGVVYVGSLDSGIYALDARNGRRRWRFDTGGEVASSPAVVGGIVYAGSADGYLYAIDAGTGEQRWRARAGQIVGAPAVADGTVYVGSWGGALYAFDAATGARRWRVPVDAEVYASPAVAGGIVYGGGVDGTIHAVDAQTGNVVWVRKVNGLYATPAVVDGVVYVGDGGGTMRALDARNGDELWRFEASGRIASSAAVAAGLVVFGSDDGQVYALRATDGGSVWRANARDGVNASPSVAGGIVYVGTVGGRLLAFDLDSGARRWALDLDGEILASAALSNGALYIGTNAGTVYKLDDESS